MDRTRDRGQLLRGGREIAEFLGWSRWLLNTRIREGHPIGSACHGHSTRELFAFSRDLEEVIASLPAANTIKRRPGSRASWKKGRSKAPAEAVAIGTDAPSTETTEEAKPEA